MNKLLSYGAAIDGIFILCYNLLGKRKIAW